MSKEFFPLRPTSRPTIYAHEDTAPQFVGLLKVGYTTVDAQSRVAKQFPPLRPGKPPFLITLGKIETEHRNELKSLMTHKFQPFRNASFLAA